MIDRSVREYLASIRYPTDISIPFNLESSAKWPFCKVVRRLKNRVRCKEVTVGVFLYLESTFDDISIESNTKAVENEGKYPTIYW